MIEILKYTFMQRAFLIGIVIALTCSILGVFLVLKKNIFISEGLAHISFAGIALGLLLGIFPIGSAMLLTTLAALLMSWLSKKSNLHNETVIGILSYSGFALGILLVSISKGFNADLFGYLFGNILAISSKDIFLSVFVLTITLSFIILFFNEMKFVTFDELSAKVSGIKTSLINYLFSIVLALTIVLAMRIVGIILVASFMIIPAATALRIAKNFKQAIIASSIFGVLSVIIGLIVSFYLNIASGSTIVLTNLAFFLLSLFIR